MAKKQVIKEYEDRGVKPFDASKKNCIVTDLDGTLALINGRGYFDPYKFDTDILNKELKKIILVLKYELCHVLANGDDAELIVITGRSSAGVGREKTEKWLRENGIAYNKLFMRKPGDFRKDYITKSEIIQELQKEYNIICAFDDRDSSAQAFRDNGVLCMQVWKDDTEQKPCEFCKKVEKSNDECVKVSTGDYDSMFLENGILYADWENSEDAENPDMNHANITLKYCPECGRKLK